MGFGIGLTTENKDLDSKKHHTLNVDKKGDLRHDETFTSKVDRSNIHKGDVVTGSKRTFNSVTNDGGSTCLGSRCLMNLNLSDLLPVGDQKVPYGLPVRIPTDIKPHKLDLPKYKQGI
mmetsp:Transcript_13160/g.22293  ORF Transcript_13160/g.22293 Transcript_13160/m.22293 type:complete len:118 (+) Transcript_13160:52-405(+)|eukprot:CAMPEP_0168608404 /NCGR_PEP_ID=MMETSP0449_2-20121227/608_1 /TAXON_ID=1082188 /ORGANISM="Strombidium rassoulzadegani, Strain ras09" /LENGTH=117 /DNA_ID=CAMNT_0008648385 /DNA_START=31 /DNA_END=384 /DNA_ORIENTATION=+